MHLKDNEEILGVVNPISENSTLTLHNTLNRDNFEKLDEITYKIAFPEKINLVKEDLKIFDPFKAIIDSKDPNNLLITIKFTVPGNPDFIMNQLLDWIKFITHREAKIVTSSLLEKFKENPNYEKSEKYLSYGNPLKRPITILTPPHFLALSLLTLKDLRLDQYNFFMRCLALYNKATTAMEIDHSISYLLFIQVIETISLVYSDIKIIFNDYTNAEKIRELTKAKLNEEDQKKLEKILLTNFGIKRKFIDTFIRFLPSDFGMKEPSSIDYDVMVEKALKNLLSKLYDLRSQYVHAGHQFPSPPSYFRKNPFVYFNEYTDGGNYRKNKDGSIRISKTISLRWLEGAVNTILKELLEHMLKNNENEEDKSRFKKKDSIIYDPSILRVNMKQDSPIAKDPHFKVIRSSDVKL